MANTANIDDAIKKAQEFLELLFGKAGELGKALASRNRELPLRAATTAAKGYVPTLPIMASALNDVLKERLENNAALQEKVRAKKKNDLQPKKDQSAENKETPQLKPKGFGSH